MTSILFVNRTGRVSGAEAVLLRLIEAAVQRGDRVRLVSPPGRLVERLPDGVDHTEIDEFDPDSFVDADYAALRGQWASLGADVGASAELGDDGLIDDDLAFVRPWGFALAEVTASVLLVQGRRDRVIPPRHAELLAEALPTGTLEFHPADGHVSVLRHLRDAL